MPTISFRPDLAAEEAMNYLVDQYGISRSDAIRLALIKLAERRRGEALRAEVARIARDTQDVKEKASTTALMDALAPPELPE